MNWTVLWTFQLVLTKCRLLVFFGNYMYWVTAGGFIGCRIYSLTSRVREVLTVSLGLGHFWEVDWQLWLTCVLLLKNLWFSANMGSKCPAQVFAPSFSIFLGQVLLPMSCCPDGFRIWGLSSLLFTFSWRFLLAKKRGFGSSMGCWLPHKCSFLLWLRGPFDLSLVSCKCFSCLAKQQHWRFGGF